MISEDAVKDRIAKLDAAGDADAVLAAALTALKAGAEGGEWFAVKAARDDAAVRNSAKSAELNRRLAAHFGEGGEEGEDAPAIALEAVARAVAAAAAEAGSAEAVSLGGDTYELKIMEPARGGRSRIRFRNPDAAPAEEAEEGGESEEG